MENRNMRRSVNNFGKTGSNKDCTYLDGPASRVAKTSSNGLEDMAFLTVNILHVFIINAEPSIESSFRIFTRALDPNACNSLIDECTK